MTYGMASTILRVQACIMAMSSLWVSACASVKSASSANESEIVAQRLEKPEKTEGSPNHPQNQVGPASSPGQGSRYAWPSGSFATGSSELDGHGSGVACAAERCGEASLTLSA